MAGTVVTVGSVTFGSFPNAPLAFTAWETLPADAQAVDGAAADGTAAEGALDAAPLDGAVDGAAAGDEHPASSAAAVSTAATGSPRANTDRPGAVRLARMKKRIGPS
ncbi:hypothetical protein [uncultured Amnibacterium sp.]|uniref:hypothetical protein n=1 Tax=uncultured Amnibacterium sp. TaxID=1631851 RepID=UPI0035CACF62